MAVDHEAVDITVRSYIDDVRNAIPIDRVFLFGSRAKGTARADSDIDLCFFSQSFEDNKPVDVVKRLFRMALKYPDYDIEPLGFPTSEIQNDNPFVKEILRTGREL